MKRQRYVFHALCRCLVFGGVVTASAVATLFGASVPEPSQPLRGFPFTRSYPLEEVGNVPRGAHLSFDRFGRLAVVYDGIYAVLNDTTWLDLADKSGDGLPLVAQGDGDRAYYAGFGTWGIVETTAEGKLRPKPLVPADPPNWARTTGFNDIIVTAHGVYFGGWNGVVYWDFATQRTQFYEIFGYAKLFSVGDKVYVASFRAAVQRIDVAAAALRPVEGTNFGDDAVGYATNLDQTRSIVATRDGRMFVFDGSVFTPWPGQIRNGLSGRVTALQHLLDGGVAVAISGKGVFIVSDTGELISSLTSPDYHRITQLATREAGVLWSAGEDGIQKTLYGSPLTVFGQRLGLSPIWPVVARWNDKIIVSSSGRLFEAVAGTGGTATRFEPLGTQPEAGAWTVAASGPHLLIGNGKGVFAAQGDGSFLPVVPDMDVARLAMVDGDFCFAIGRVEIAAVRWADGRWSECAPRIPTVGFPSVVQRARKSVWIELGANRVARVSVHDGKLRSQVFENFPWPPRWINVGIVDDTVVLSGPPGKRLFYDEATEAFCAAPELQRLLDQSPSWIARVQKDESGTLWATHDEGVVVYVPTNGSYRLDTTTFDLNNEHYPVVQLLPGNDVWLSSGQSLYHVDQHRTFAAGGALRPMLISVADGRTSVELLDNADPSRPPLQLPFSRNSLNFRFFAGSYAWRRAPSYEFRLSSRQAHWTSLGTGSLLSFPRLREGSYRLDVRVANAQGPIGRPTSFEFEILPPWHRTVPAYALYGLVGALAVFGLVRWSVQRTYRRNLALEKIVQERTDQLKATMQKLNDETRNAATLAERDRLAGEIHDSLQQGLSGLMLQLDATLKLPTLTSDVRSRLNVARNMVSFTRHEVQHAVWDLESPLLEDTELGDALRKLTALISPGAAQMDLAVSGAHVSLPSGTKHHLLRIGQEAITNAVRHAAATRISIRLDYQADMVRLTVADDGVGFQPDDVLVKSIGHFGLRGLRSRATKIGGTLRIDSSPGNGTSIEIVVPLVNHQNLPSHALSSAV